MQNLTRPPQRWEYIASAVATASATIVTIMTSSTGRMSQLPTIVEHLENPSAMLVLVTDIPRFVWWIITVVFAALLYWIGTRLAKRWGTLALVIAPVVMIVLLYLVPWVLFAPVRAALPPASSL